VGGGNSVSKGKGKVVPVFKYDAIKMYPSLNEAPCHVSLGYNYTQLLGKTYLPI